MGFAKKILHVLSPPSDTESDGRDKFPNRLSFILAAVGGAVGLGNVLRYPSVVFQNSGLQWFIPYLIALIFLGLPVLLLELSLGNAYRAGVVTSFNGINRRARGVGLGVVLTGYMVVCYYVPILSWVMHYFRSSFQSPLPWDGRGNDFYMMDVIANKDPIPGEINAAGDVVRYTEYPGSGMVGETVGWTAFIWFCVWLSMFKGVALTGRAIYFTMGLPIVMLIILLGRSASLDDAIVGVRYYFAEWHGEKLGSGKIWQAACGQIFFSIGVGFGYFTTYSSYSSRFANIVQDTLIIAFSNSMFEIVAGFVVFSIVGFLGLDPNNPADETAVGTFTIGFLTYPLALSQMSGSNFFSVIWFLTIALLGVSSSVALIESLVTILNESLLGNHVKRWKTATAIVFISFLISLVYCTQFGYYFLDAVDTWVNNITLLLIVWSEIVAMSVLYRKPDVCDQVGKLAFYLNAATYVLSMFLGVVVGQAVSPGAGAGVGFGIFVFGTIASVLLARTPTSVAPRFFGRSALFSKFWWLAFYSTNQLRRDFNVILSHGGNWRIPIFWGPVMRYISAPILAIIASFAYPDFYARGRLDPLHICGFTFAHVALFFAVAGLIVPRAFDVFVQPDRRNESKITAAPQALMPGFVARVHEARGGIVHGEEAGTYDNTYDNGTEHSGSGHGSGKKLEG